MDFANRNAQPPAPTQSAPAAATSGSTKKNKKDNGKWTRVAIAAAVAAVLILLIAAVVYWVRAADLNREGKYVDSSKLQAVFLNTGQVYFGNITALNNRYTVLTNIYYLQTTGNTAAGSTANPNVSLVKLGCELHKPYDQMVINSDQITFWENLGDNGQVAQAVQTFEKQNPEGQKCADQSSSANPNSGNAAQNAGTTNNTNTNTPNTNTDTTP